MLQHSEIGKRFFFWPFLILSLLYLKPVLAQDTSQQTAGDLELVKSSTLNYSNSAFIPQPFDVQFYQDFLLISDPKLATLFLLDKDTLEVVDFLTTSQDNSTIFEGGTDLAIDPVTQNLAVPGQYSDSIALFSHKRTPLTVMQYLTNADLNFPDSLKNPYHASYDTSGQVLLISSRQSSDLNAFKTNSSSLLTYWDSLNVSEDRATEVAFIMADPSVNAFYLALNKKDESTGLPLTGTVFKLGFNLEQNQWAQPEAVISAPFLKDITGMTITPETEKGRFLVVVSYTNSAVYFYREKRHHSGDWELFSSFANTNIQYTPDSFDGVHSAVSAIPANDERPCVHVSSSQHIHSFVWNNHLSEWQHTKALLVRHENRSPGLSSLTLSEDGRTIVAIGAMTGTVHKAKFSSAPRIEHPVYEFAYNEQDANEHQFLVGALTIKNANVADTGDTSNLNTTVYWKELSDCPFYWENNQVLYKPDCGVSLSNDDWQLSINFPANLQACNQFNLCSQTSILVQVTPDDLWTRRFKWAVSLLIPTFSFLGAGILTFKYFTPYGSYFPKDDGNYSKLDQPSLDSEDLTSRPETMPLLSDGCQGDISFDIEVVPLNGNDISNTTMTSKEIAHRQLRKLRGEYYPITIFGRAVLGPTDQENQEHNVTTHLLETSFSLPNTSNSVPSRVK